MERFFGACFYIICMTCMENKYKASDLWCIKAHLLQRQLRDLSQIINSALDTLFKVVAEFPQPGLHRHKAHMPGCFRQNMDNMRSFLSLEG